MLKIALQAIADRLGAPILVTAPTDGSQRAFIVDQLGTIQILMADGTILPEPFLDLSERVNQLYQNRDDERGLLGLAFHPNFAANGRFFVFYTTPPRSGSEFYDHTNTLAEFSVDAITPNRADPASERILLQFEQQFDSHAAGQLAFDPATGYLYVAIGDALNETTFPQRCDSYFGKILRIDVDNGDPYGIPFDNPFVGQEGLEEIYALGLRHPWRLSVDTVTNSVYIAEPAWRFHYQTIHTIQPAANYGWAVHAQPFCYDPGQSMPRADGLTTPNGTPITPPVVEYGPTVGNIVSGVALYRGNAIPALHGKLLFTEWGLQVEDGAKMLAATPAEGGNWQFAPIEIGNFPEDATYFWGMGQDAEGELYLLTMNELSPQAKSGKVFKIVATE